MGSATVSGIVTPANRHHIKFEVKSASKVVDEIIMASVNSGDVTHANGIVVVVESDRSLEVKSKRMLVYDEVKLVSEDATNSLDVDLDSK